MHMALMVHTQFLALHVFNNYYFHYHGGPCRFFPAEMTFQNRTTRVINIMMSKMPEMAYLKKKIDSS